MKGGVRFYIWEVKECFPNGVIVERRPEQGEKTGHMVMWGTVLQTEGTSGVPEIGKSSVESMIGDAVRKMPGTDNIGLCQGSPDLPQVQ